MVTARGGGRGGGTGAGGRTLRGGLAGFLRKMGGARLVVGGAGTLLKAMNLRCHILNMHSTCVGRACTDACMRAPFFLGEGPRGGVGNHHGRGTTKLPR